MYNIVHLHQQFCEHAFTFKGNSKKTIITYENTFNKFFYTTEILDIRSVTRQSIESYIIEGKRLNNWAAKTIRNHLLYLSLFFDWAIQNNIIQENPVKDISRPKLPKKLPRSLSKQQAFDLLDWTRNYPYYYQFERYRSTAILATFIFTGIRLRELYNLQMVDLDIKDRKILIVRSGKGNKDRIIPLNNRLIDFLHPYLRAREKLGRTTPYFFTALRQNKKMGDSTVKCLVEKIRKHCGIYFTPHMLRHTFATLMLEGGCDIYSLSKMLGHADIQTTTIYLSASSTHLQKQMLKHPLYV